MEQIKRACELVGGISKMSILLGVSGPTVSQWCTGDRPIPAIRCTAIEQATSGAVTRRDLRPDDWQKIWPELAHPRAAGSCAAIEPVAAQGSV